MRDQRWSLAAAAKAARIETAVQALRQTLVDMVDVEKNETSRAGREVCGADTVLSGSEGFPGVYEVSSWLTCGTSCSKDINDATIWLCRRIVCLGG